jgi:glycosyltransferase involved in cell wall biosynthesis
MRPQLVTTLSDRSMAANRQPTLSLIIPVHNEEEVLEQQTRKLVEYVQSLMEKFEVLFVENGSTDQTSHIIEKLQKHFSFIRLIRLRKADYSTAVIKGVKAARGKYSIVMGIDYVDLEVLNRCLCALEEHDIVICSKNKGVDKRPFMNRLANQCYNKLAKLFFGLKYSDMEGYHGYNTRKIQKIIDDVKTKAHLCNLWVLLKARKVGLKVAEVPLIVYERRKSKFMTIARLPYLAVISLIEFIKLKCKGY